MPTATSLVRSVNAVAVARPKTVTAIVRVLTVKAVKG